MQAMKFLIVASLLASCEKKADETQKALEIGWSQVEDFRKAAPLDATIEARSICDMEEDFFLLIC